MFLRPNGIWKECAVTCSLRGNDVPARWYSLSPKKSVSSGSVRAHEFYQLLRSNTLYVDTISMCRTPLTSCAGLEHKSIRENILFGYPFEEDRYQEVLERCALNPDLAILEDGDLTEIGARGVSLSGGQVRFIYFPLTAPFSFIHIQKARSVR
jgi:hypothetical protein